MAFSGNCRYRESVIGKPITNISGLNHLHGYIKAVDMCEKELRQSKVVLKSKKISNKENSEMSYIRD